MLTQYYVMVYREQVEKTDEVIHESDKDKWIV